MAETTTKNYTSKYSGDQLDAAIAVLGSLDTLFFSVTKFQDFVDQFNTKMNKLNGDVTELLNFARSAAISYTEIEQ